MERVAFNVDGEIHDFTVGEVRISKRECEVIRKDLPVMYKTHWFVTMYPATNRQGSRGYTVNISFETKERAYEWYKALEDGGPLDQYFTKDGAH